MNFILHNLSIALPVSFPFVLTLECLIIFEVSLVSFLTSWSGTDFSSSLSELKCRISVRIVSYAVLVLFENVDVNFCMGTCGH